MVTILDNPQIRPSATLIKQLERIGEIKEALGRYDHQACSSLGIQVYLNSYDSDCSPANGPEKTRKSRKDDFRRLKVMVGPNVCLDAYSKGVPSEDWALMVYEPGVWQERCQPTLRLCQWLQDWGGLHPEMQLTLQIAFENFKKTGELSIPLRQETGGRLCGRCGDEVKDLAGHIYGLHDRANAIMPLSGYLRVRGGRKSVMVIHGKGRDQHMWTIPEELHRRDLNAPGFQPGLAQDIDRIFSITGKSRLPAISGKYPLPSEITPLPYLANVLRRLTQGNGSFLEGSCH